MKKLLLGTTAIVGASILAATAAQAAKPELKIDGYFRFETWFVSQDLDSYLNSSSNQGVYMDMDDVEIHFQGSATADNGLEYGFYAEIQEGSGDSAGNIGFDEANVFLAGNWGRLDLGSQDGVEYNYNVTAQGLSADKDGAWDGNNGFKDGSTTAPYKKEALYDGDSNKITYYTPNFSGFKAGVSYTPNVGASENSNFYAESTNSQHDLVGAAIKYSGTFSDVGVDVGVRYEQGNVNDSPAADYNDIQVWGLGLKVSYAGFAVAGSYTDLGDSAVSKANETLGADAGQFWTVGASYATGPYKVSVVFEQAKAGTTTAEDDEVNYLQIGGNYAVADGLDIYAAYQHVELDRTGTANDNDVDSFLVGTQVSF